MHWRLVLEEFGQELNYIKVINNFFADALSRLDMDTQQEIFNLTAVAEYNNDDISPGGFPREIDISRILLTKPLIFFGGVSCPVELLNAA